MNEFINVLHLTDLHFGMEGDPKIAPTAMAQRQNALTPLVKLLSTLRREWRPMIVTVSGDIGWRGAVSDYAAAAPFLAKLLDQLELPRNRLVMCAGNHDLDRKATIGTLPPPSSREADEWLRIENLANLERPFAAYMEFCAGFGVEPLRIADGSHRLVGQCDLLGLRFIVLNSAWFCRNDHDKGQLWIGLPQLQLMQSRAQLAEPNADGAPITIGLLHHPPHDLNEAETNAYGNRPATYRYLAQRAHLLLSGHVHGGVEKATRHHQGAFGIVGGASYAEGGYRNNFSILRVAPGSREIHRRSYEYDPRYEEWRPFEEEETLSLRIMAQRARHAPGTAVHFRTERLADDIDLQRAVHTVLKQPSISEDRLVDLVYDERIAALTARLERRYMRYREEMSEAGDPEPDAADLDQLRSAIDQASLYLAELPRQLVLFAEKTQECSAFRSSGKFSARACSRLIELTMTSVLSRIASYQLPSDDPLYFVGYAGITNYRNYIAKIDEVQERDMASYYIAPAGGGRIQLIFAPINYGGREGWLVDDCGVPADGIYHPPISFLTDYLFPQIAHRAWLDPKQWNFSGECSAIYFKD